MSKYKELSLFYCLKNMPTTMVFVIDKLMRNLGITEITITEAERARII